MTLKLQGSTSGHTAIEAPASAGSNTLVLPPNNGTAGQILQTDGNGNLTWVDKPVSTGWVKVFSTSTNDTSGEIAIENTSLFDGTYKRCKIVIFHSMIGSDDKEVRLTFKLNGSYVTGNQYAYVWRQRSSASGSTVTDNSTAKAYIPIIESVGNATGEGFEGTIEWSDPTSTTHWKRCNWNITAGKLSGDFIQNIGGGTVNGTNANTALTGIKMAMSGGDFGAIHYAGYGLTL